MRILNGNSMFGYCIVIVLLHFQCNPEPLIITENVIILDFREDPLRVGVFDEGMVVYPVIILSVPVEEERCTLNHEFFLSTVNGSNLDTISLKASILNEECRVRQNTILLTPKYPIYSAIFEPSVFKQGLETSFKNGKSKLIMTSNEHAFGQGVISVELDFFECITSSTQYINLLDGFRCR